MSNCTGDMYQVMFMLFSCAIILSHHQGHVQNPLSSERSTREHSGSHLSDSRDNYNPLSDSRPALSLEYINFVDGAITPEKVREIIAGK